MVDIPEKFGEFEYIELIKLRKYQQHLIKNASPDGMVTIPAYLLDKIAALETARTREIYRLAEEWDERSKGRSYLQIATIASLPKAPVSYEVAMNRFVTHTTITLPPKDAPWRLGVIEDEARKYLADLWEKQTGLKNDFSH